MKKCQHCEKPATFHITELTEPTGPVMLHLCEEHARVYLAQEETDSPSNALAGMLAKQLKLEQTAEELAKLDKKTCPVCGITFAEFRNMGRLGCAYDYVCFREDLEPLLMNIHGAKSHRGKRPSRNAGSPDRQHEIIQLRREMQEAIAREEYERAGELRDQIRDIEAGESDPTSTALDSPKSTTESKSAAKPKTRSAKGQGGKSRSSKESGSKGPSAKGPTSKDTTSKGPTSKGSTSKKKTTKRKPKDADESAGEDSGDSRPEED